jgi:hypothetical protein
MDCRQSGFRLSAACDEVGHKSGEQIQNTSPGFPSDEEVRAHLSADVRVAKANWMTGCRIHYGPP